MSRQPGASIIIPTYNRKNSLRRTLASLAEQTLPVEQFEVIVVDDGSTDGTGDVAWDEFPFAVRYFCQKNAGATVARNTGAGQSSAEFLIFLDDDILPAPTMLAALVRDMANLGQVIALATLVCLADDLTVPFTRLYCRGAIFPGDMDTLAADGSLATDESFVHFNQCKTGVLGIRRADFCKLNMFQDPTGGWPSWDDLDFGYRAYLQGFRLWRSARAVAYHYDHSLRSLESSCARAERTGQSAARFLERYPELMVHIPTLQDKAPLSFAADRPKLLVRKVLRSIVSSPPGVLAMRQLTRLLEKYRTDSLLLVLLYRWILSAYIYKGFRRGLRELARTKP